MQEHQSMPKEALTRKVAVQKVRNWSLGAPAAANMEQFQLLAQTVEHVLHHRLKQLKCRGLKRWNGWRRSRSKQGEPVDSQFPVV